MFKISYKKSYEKYPSLKRRAILKIPCIVFEKKLCSFCWFKMKPLRKSILPMLRKKPIQTQITRNPNSFFMDFNFKFVNLASHQWLLNLHQLPDFYCEILAFNWSYSLWTHCAKSVQKRSSFWSLFFCIQPKYVKIRTRKNSVFGHFLREDWLIIIIITLAPCLLVKAINEFIILRIWKNMLNLPFLMAMVKLLIMYLFILIFFIKQSITKFKEFKETRDCMSLCLFFL